MKILSVSDIELGFLYNTHIAHRFGDVDVVISCGDLPYYYLEFIVSMLDKPLYFVRGNHASRLETGTGGDRSAPWGATNLHRRVLRDPSGLLLAGIEGSLRYNKGPHQYTQAEMWWMALLMAPRLLLNQARYGRALDILVTHAPPWKVGDQDDLPHTGIKAFRWLIRVFRPIYHLHGHIHLYRSHRLDPVRFHQTLVLNSYGYRELALELPSRKHSSVQTLLIEGSTNDPEQPSSLGPD